jgi:hypothetical protein
MRKLLVVICATVFLAGAAILVVAKGQGTVTKAKRVPQAKAVEAKLAKAGRVPSGTRTRDNSVARLEQEIKLTAAPAAFGTITYDTLTINAVPTVASRAFGNQFNTAVTVGGGAPGPVQVNGTITKLTWAMWGTTTATSWGTFWITFYGPVNGTTASVITSYTFSGVGGAGPQLLNYTFSTPVAYTGSSFLVAMYNSNSLGSPPWNGPCPLFGGGTVNGQGYHGMGINWSTTTGTGFAQVTSLNAIMRPTGNLLIPVELMSFSVE